MKSSQLHGLHGYTGIHGDTQRDTEIEIPPSVFPRVPLCSPQLHGDTEIEILPTVSPRVPLCSPVSPCKPYPSYRDSHIPWLPKIPAGWETVKLCSTFEERRNKVSDKEYAPLSVTRHGIVPQLATVAKSDDSDNRKKVVAGDFVINSRSDRKGSSGISKYTGSVSLINTVITPSNDWVAEYVHYLLRGIPFQEEFYRVGKGIHSDLWSTNYSVMRAIMLPIPTRPEQDKIVQFLDWKIAQINKFVRAKRREIELLKEQKQAVINQAVTRGLDPSAPLRNSGIPGLGKIPKHWEVMRFKHIVKNINEVADWDNDTEKCRASKNGERVFQPVQNGQECPFSVHSNSPIKFSLKYIALENVESWTGRIVESETEITPENKVKAFLKNDVLFAKLRPYLAKVILPDCDGVCSSEFLVLQNRSKEMKPSFIAYKLRSYSIISLINSSTFGAKMPRADWTFIGNLMFSYPPLCEQKKSLNMLKKNQRLWTPSFPSPKSP